MEHPHAGRPENNLGSATYEYLLVTVAGGDALGACS